ncbi:MAG: tryptophan synthase subunit alpha [Treponema sp.]|jgi:tryptophan synthase alpha subunit|nr:tryptophan synthase subunit alpha [Treponema sp.]
MAKLVEVRVLTCGTARPRAVASWAVGFGIHTAEQAAKTAHIADGVIVGSAIVKLAAEHGAEAGPHIYRYVKEMKEAVRGGETGQAAAL